MYTAQEHDFPLRKAKFILLLLTGILWVLDGNGEASIHASIHDDYKHIAKATK